MNIAVLQSIIALVTLLSFLGGACAFLFVIWPSIRNAERRGARLEAWLDGPEGKKIISSFMSKIGIEEGGAPSSRSEFLDSGVSAKDSEASPL